MQEPNIKIIINTIEIRKTFPEEIETTNTDYFNFRINSQEELEYLNSKIYEFIREDFNQKMHEIAKEIENKRLCKN